MKTLDWRIGLLGALAVAVLGGCEKTSAPEQPLAAAHRHEHVAPHGGTPVVLGAEAFHLEWVRDAETGTLRVYVLDGHMENFVRAGSPGFDVVATVGGAIDTLVFRPVADAATGETETDTSLYEARAEWLKTTPAFGATVLAITIQGRTFREVSFRFPEGNEHE